MKLEIKNSLSKDELLRTLSDTSIDVPARTNRRKTGHTEKWTMAYLLATLAHKNICKFPLNLAHEDKPDFVLTMGTKRTGIEVTEAIPPDFAKCCAIRDKEFPKAVLDISLFKWGSPSKTTDEIREILRRGKLTGPGWAGYSVEEEWACFIKSAIDTKLVKLRSGNYSEMQDYWLSIYDNLPLPNAFVRAASTALFSKLKEYWAEEKTYSRVFIEKGPIIIEVTKKGAKHRKRHNPWS